MTSSLQTDAFLPRRESMVRTQLLARGIRDERVLGAMARVPRHEFVPEEYREQAYEDHPLPIREDQTVSQPYIVAIMLEALALAPGDTVLEVGTGSGYVTAILCELAKQVYSVERIPSLAQSAKATITRLGYRNASIETGDGSQGLPERAPFDAIIVSAAAPRVPEALLAQLREGGRMVIPVGPVQAQVLKLVRRHQGQMVIADLEGCRFVPLIGGQGYPSAS